MADVRDLSRVRRSCTNRDMRSLLIGAMERYRYRMTKSGVVLYGENGMSTAAHFTTSDGRALKNFKANLRALEQPQREDQ